jgi:ubiquinone/menaquinone biosynthesis C-methylase UbiE
LPKIDTFTDESNLMRENIDKLVVEGFGDEWSRFDQSALSAEELERMFDNYFNIFPWSKLPPNAKGFDLGCGSGRWAKLVAPRVGELHLIDASAEALNVAREKLKDASNCHFHHASVESIPLENGSCDFGYSLGVLHHIPDTEAGLQYCTEKLKSGAPFLLYLYYRFDNRPFWFRWLWRASDFIRQGVCRLPHSLRYMISQVLALILYLPLARTALLLEKIGFNVEKFPLSQYRYNSFYVMRNDALDRFGTRLEKRFTKLEIEDMMKRAGLENITFSQNSFWTAVGFKK